MDKSDWQNHLEQIESQIRSGQAHLGRPTILKLARRPIPPLFLERFALVARRCDLWHLSLKHLKPRIYPKVKGRRQAGNGEKVEYALALQRATALQESLQILSHPDLKDHPPAALARAFAEMKRWNFARALAHVEQYLANQNSLTEYQVLVARINRLACLSHTADPRFFTEYDDLSPKLDTPSSRLLWANAQEIWAARMLDLRQYRETLEKMKLTLAKFDQKDGPYHLLLKKYERVAQALINENTDELLAFRSEALKHGDWETLRQLDYYATFLVPEGQWALRAYFGTPFESFRAKLLTLREFPRECIFQAQESRVSKPFDPWFPGKNEGDLIHRCLVHTLEDWYKPLSNGALFAALHPEEKFDVESSTTRVRKLLQRMKAWIPKIGAPFRLTQIENLHALRMSPSAAIKVRENNLNLSKIPFLFDRYQETVTGSLSAEEWSKKLRLSKRQTIDLLNEGLTAEKIQRIGSGRYSEYSLIKK